MKKDAEKIKSAAEWQGTDRYAGIDSYEKIELKAGTQVCALISYDKEGKMKPCEYLFPKEQLDQVGNDATQLSEKLQVRPFIDSMLKSGSYRSEVAMFELKRDLVVEGGKIAENTSYGEGGLTQYYIPATKFSNYLEDGTLKHAKFGKSSEVLLLDHLSLSEKQCKEIVSKQNQLLMRRNLFCHQKAKLDAIDIIQNSPNSTDVVKAVENLEKLNGHIFQIKKDLSDSVKAIGPVRSPLYDSLNKQLAVEIKYREMHPDTLVLSNVKLKGEESRTTQEIFDKSNLNVVVIDHRQSKVEEISENLFNKMNGYKPEKEWNDIDVKAQGLGEVMNINQINQQSKTLMQATELRIRDFSQVETIALQGSDGKMMECALASHFTEASVQKIQQGTNGELTEALEMKDGRLAKLYMEGNRAQLFLSKDRVEMEQQVNHLPIEQSDKKLLLAGGAVMCNNMLMKIDGELNAIVPAPRGPMAGCAANMCVAPTVVKHHTKPKKRKGMSV